MLMIEGFARELPEDLMAEAIMAGPRLVREMCELQEELLDQVQPVKKRTKSAPPDALGSNTLAGEVLRRRSGRPSRPPASRPGREAVEALKEKGSPS